MTIPKNSSTLSAAREWDKTKAHYMRLGLDSRCAAQAAYGSQDGFSRVHPPCAECLPTVATFPTNQPGPWRSHSRRRNPGAPQNMPSPQHGIPL